VATCAECHWEIDPLGFVLENFDPIGSVRFVYRDGQGAPAGKVDTSGPLATGERFKNVAELKELLLQRTNRFAHCLSEKMLFHALGCRLDFRDRPQIEAIAAALASRGYGLRDLVELIVASDAFVDRVAKTLVKKNSRSCFPMTTAAFEIWWPHANRRPGLP
jgi:hypothetical protein